MLLCLSDIHVRDRHGWTVNASQQPIHLVPTHVCQENRIPIFNERSSIAERLCPGTVFSTKVARLKRRMQAMAASEWSSFEEEEAWLKTQDSDKADAFRARGYQLASQHRRRVRPQPSQPSQRSRAAAQAVADEAPDDIIALDSESDGDEDYLAGQTFNQDEELEDDDDDSYGSSSEDDENFDFAAQASIVRTRTNRCLQRARQIDSPAVYDDGVDGDADAAPSQPNVPPSRRNIYMQSVQNTSSVAVAAPARVPQKQKKKKDLSWRDYLPSEWVRTCEANSTPYFPQVGDKIMYFPQGHAEYVINARETGLFKTRFDCGLLCFYLSCCLLSICLC